MYCLFERVNEYKCDLNLYSFHLRPVVPVCFVTTLAYMAMENEAGIADFGKSKDDIACSIVHCPSSYLACFSRLSCSGGGHLLIAGSSGSGSLGTFL